VHTVGLKSNGTVVSTESWASGEEINVSGWRNIVAVSASRSYTLGLRSDGTVVIAGDIWSDYLDFSDWYDIKIP